MTVGGWVQVSDWALFVVTIIILCAVLAGFLLGGFAPKAVKRLRA